MKNASMTGAMNIGRALRRSIGFIGSAIPWRVVPQQCCLRFTEAIILPDHFRGSIGTKVQKSGCWDSPLAKITEIG
jgi:hypothetical protein